MEDIHTSKLYSLLDINMKLYSFLALEENWDSYNALKITRESIESAKKIAEVLYQMDIYFAPFPSPTGGVTFDSLGTPPEFILDVFPDGNSFTLSVWVDDKEVCEELIIDMDNNNDWVYSLEKIFYGNMF